MQRLYGLFSLSFFLLLVFAAPALHATWYEEDFSAKRAVVVTSPADSGPGTLRQALLDAQADDHITFDPVVFSPTSPVTITLSSELPNITINGLKIDATQAGVLLDGRDLGVSTGLTIQAADRVTIQGLQILNFSYGIEITRGASHALIGGDRESGTAPLGEGNLISNNSFVGITLRDADTSNNRIEGNYIGPDLTGEVKLGEQANGIHIDIGASDNHIGGDTPNRQNLISGHSGMGIVIDGAESNRNRISGNWIGVNRSCTSALGNQNGVLLRNTSDHVIEGNVISGNSIGVQLINSTNNNIIGNDIGLDCTGSQIIGNEETGVLLSTGATNNVIGGEVPNVNVISGNDGYGISLLGASENQIIGNYIGTDKNGQQALGNRSGGILIAGGASNNLIGGNKTDGSRNIISGNEGVGIRIQNEGTSGNQVRGNFIGTDATGSTLLGERQAGIDLVSGASDNIIGGDTSQAENLIRGNQNGIRMTSDTTGNLIKGNYISSKLEPSIISRGTENTFDKNFVSCNKDLPALIYPRSLGHGANENKFEANCVIQVTGRMLTEDELWSKQGDLKAYLVVAEDLAIAPGATLTVTEGVNLQFDFGRGASIFGTLVAEGSADKPVRFTSAQRFAKPLSGDWQGLTFAPSSKGLLQHANIEFATNGLTLNQGEVEVISSTISASANDGILVQDGTLTLKSSALAGHGNFALNNLTDTPIDASGTWWGSATGATHASNPAMVIVWAIATKKRGIDHLLVRKKDSMRDLSIYEKMAGC